jgi:hypothetical protein
LPGEIVDRRLVAARAVERLFHGYGDAVIVNPDVVGTAVDA